MNRREDGPLPKQRQGEAEETNAGKKCKRHPPIDVVDKSTEREDPTSRTDMGYKTRSRDAQDWREAKDNTGRPRDDRRIAAEPEEDWEVPKGTKEDAGNRTVKSRRHRKKTDKTEETTTKRSNRKGK